ncbi:hypothetical protein KKA09_03260 [Patescibacteria group bacterium]|nr:hypothetical protein [Patescibacteria group bacterium]
MFGVYFQHSLDEEFYGIKGIKINTGAKKGNIPQTFGWGIKFQLNV